MILAVDVAYHDPGANVAGLLFQSWRDETPQHELTIHLAEVKEYIPGQFYQRELPCILALLAEISEPLAAIVIDGYVYLGKNKTPGLGMHLYHAFAEQIPVIGVAKSTFHETPQETAVYRGQSQRPLYVTAIGIDEEFARKAVANMAGPHRIPALLKRVDQLCRQFTPSRD
jgi:deoxyribonuclease V